MPNGLRIFLFVVFFGAGFGAVYISISCDEWIGHYKNRQMLVEHQNTTEALKSLISDYESRLATIKSDPNFAEKMAPSVLGYERSDSQAIYPELTDDQLQQAKKALAKSGDDQAEQVEVPNWLIRADDPLKKKILFFSGVLLVVISLVWFVWYKPQDDTPARIESES